MAGWHKLFFPVRSWHFANEELCLTPMMVTQAGLCPRMTFLFVPMHLTVMSDHGNSHNWNSQLYFQSDLTILRSWYISGINYSHTLENWLKLQDKNTQG
jgi:hypothetical protein